MSHVLRFCVVNQVRGADHTESEVCHHPAVCAGSQKPIPRGGPGLRKNRFLTGFGAWLELPRLRQWPVYREVRPSRRRSCVVFVIASVSYRPSHEEVSRLSEECDVACHRNP